MPTPLDILKRFRPIMIDHVVMGPVRPRQPTQTNTESELFARPRDGLSDFVGNVADLWEKTTTTTTTTNRNDETRTYCFSWGEENQGSRFRP